jgi:deoxyribodipyrimidine photo-lyase
MAGTAIVWFRRDLRVHDHPALHRAVERFDRVACAFVLDDALLGGRYESASRTRFMLGCLEALDDELAQRGGGLTVRHGPPERELPALAAQTGAEAVLWTADVSPYARARDRRVAEALRGVGVAAHPLAGTYVVDDVTAPGTQRVFSPYFRAWSAAERRPVLPAPPRVEAPRDVNVPGTETLRCLAPEVGGGVPDPIRVAGEPAARRALDDWFGGPLEDYRQNLRSSILSPYLRWGCLSARECEARALGNGSRGAQAWRRELAWRDFYAQTLLTHPGNVRTEQQERMRGLEYEDHPERLAAWQEGRTGFPFVDAGMRQLAAQGWMPNRARLVAGSLLTKELQIDWRQGEDHFARYLLDGEPAQNNGNWQWIASVGTDPAPYFRRMYSPERHQERFDPDGAYVRRWVPELGTPEYPAPIVDRREGRARAKERYNRATAA